MRRSVFLSSLLSLFCFTLFAQVELGRKHVEQLCSPAFHGRGYVNGGDSIAAEYVAEAFKLAGCSFLKKGPFQKFLMKVNTFPGAMQLRINDKILKPGVDFIVDASSGSAVLKQVSIYSIHSSLFFQLSKLKSVLDSIQRKAQPVALMVDLTSLKGDSLKTAASLLPTLATAFPLIQVEDTKFTWTVSDEQSPALWVHVQKSALPPAPKNVTCLVEARIKQHNARNVMAYVPAKSGAKKKPYLVFTAHYDHLGRMGQDTYFPGGNDNASGTAMLLTLADYFVKNPLDVNILFVAFAGEEAGLLGSSYYVNHPIVPLDKMIFLTNIDIMGSGEEGITVVNGTTQPNAFDMLNVINDEQKLLTKIAKRGPAANSDHYPFSQAGVPAIFIYTMGPNKHYHDVFDTYSELSFGAFNNLFQLLKEFAVRNTTKG